MKVLVQAKNVLLLGFNNDVYEPDRPCVVHNNSFCQAKIAAGVVTVLKGELPDAATDAEWLKFYLEADKDYELALESFLAKFVAAEDIQEEALKLEEEARLKDAEQRNALEAQQEAEDAAKAQKEAEDAAKAQQEAEDAAAAEAAAKVQQEADTAAAAAAKEAKKAGK